LFSYTVPKNRLARFMPALLIFATLWGCGAPPTHEAREDNGLIRVTATTGMIADAAREVGGARVVVEALMGPGVDPHLYKASQRDLMKLTEADLVLYNGLHLEGRMESVLSRLGQTRQTIQVTDRIPRDRLLLADEGEDVYDPHVWFDVSLWKEVVLRIRDGLSAVSPEDSAYFAKNTETYLAALDELDAYAREQLATIPSAARVLVTAHDAFGYFGRAYDVEVVALQGISTTAEFGLQDVERLSDLIVARKIKAVFVESSLSPRSINSLVQGVQARGHDVVIGGEIYSDALGAAGSSESTYVGMFRYNVDTLVEALK